jgi:NitT/TauT family transport system permease protein
MRAVSRFPGGSMAASLERWALKLSGVFILILLWELLPRFHILDPQFLPTFSQTLAGMGKLLVEGVLFTSIMVSLWRALVGLLIAVIFAIPLGLFFGRLHRDAERAFNPFFRMLSQVNPFSLMPVFILFFGIGEEVKIAVVAWVCVWPVLFNSIEGARNIDPLVIKTARAMATTRGAMLFRIILPGAGASIFVGLRIGLEMSFFMLVVAEMVGASSGLGWLLHNSAMNIQFVRMYSAILGTVILGYAMSRFLRMIQAQVFFWREELALVNRNGKVTGARGVSRRNRDLGFAGILILAILVVGAWQVRVSKAEQANFNHMPHTGHMSAGSLGME